MTASLTHEHATQPKACWRATHEPEKGSTTSGPYDAGLCGHPCLACFFEYGIPPYSHSESTGSSCTDSIAASGIVEAQTENIAVGAPLPGIVTQVKVRVGQKVQAGDALFCLDDRELRADLKCQEANVHAAQAQLARLENQPRLEELPAAEARVREAEANLRQAKDRLDRERRLVGQPATSAESLVHHQQAFQAPKNNLHVRKQT